MYIYIYVYITCHISYMSYMPPPYNHLNEFENAMYNMKKNIKFRSLRNIFQSKLKEDLKKVKSSGKITVLADKTTNMYEMSKEEYI